MAIDFDRLGVTALAPLRAPTPGAASHFVHLYASDEALTDSVGTFVTYGLRSGEAAVIIPERKHLEAIEEALSESGIDLVPLRREGLYVSRSAEEFVEDFMVGGEADRERFLDAMGSLIAAAHARTGRVRVFGAMVAVLWAQGNLTGALELEKLWNELAEQHPFELFCAYPASGFENDDLMMLGAVCHQHTHVLPPRRSR